MKHVELTMIVGGTSTFTDSVLREIAYDVRDIYKVLSHFNNSGKVILVAQFLGQKGVLLAIIKDKSDIRPNDCQVLFCLCPADEDWMKKNSSFGDTIKECISDFESEKYEDALLKLQEYTPQSLDYTAIISQIQSITAPIPYGFVLYGSGTRYNLNEVLTTKLAQKEYANYTRIIFLDIEKDNIPTESTNIRKLDLDTKKTTVVAFPQKKEHDFTPKVFFNNQQIDDTNQKREMYVGDTFSVQWEKKGYKTILKEDIEVKENQEETEKQWKINQNEILWLFDLDTIEITLEDTKEKRKGSEVLQQDDTKYEKNNTHYLLIPENKKDHPIRFRINEPGYETKNNIEIKPDNKSQSITLQRQKVQNQWDIQDKYGTKINGLVLIQEEDSPIEQKNNSATRSGNHGQGDGSSMRKKIIQYVKWIFQDSDQKSNQEQSSNKSPLPGYKIVEKPGGINQGAKRGTLRRKRTRRTPGCVVLLIGLILGFLIGFFGPIIFNRQNQLNGQGKNDPKNGSNTTAANNDASKEVNQDTTIYRQNLDSADKASVEPKGQQGQPQENTRIPDPATQGAENTQKPDKNSQKKPNEASPQKESTAEKGTSSQPKQNKPAQSPNF